MKLIDLVNVPENKKVEGSAWIGEQMNNAENYGYNQAIRVIESMNQKEVRVEDIIKVMEESKEMFWSKERECLTDAKLKEYTAQAILTYLAGLKENKT